ncbi:SPOR domain-containing protein [Magnetococcus sp. PR-3]|uniref:SPOR domain-containing protein n=1 Tax=Magnetococcus sp. PR-3 TaxID=3120355 RepID=UPI002FCE286C
MYLWNQTFRVLCVLSISLALSGCATLLRPKPPKQETQNALNLAYRGELVAKRGGYAASIKFFTQALQHEDLTPLQRAIVLNNRGSSYKRLGQDAQALKDLDRSLSLHPEHPRYLNNRAMVKLFLEDYTGSQEDFSSLLDKHPNLPTPYPKLWRFFAMVQNGQKDARAWLEAQLPSLEPYVWQESLALFHLGQLDRRQLMALSLTLKQGRHEMRRCEWLMHTALDDMLLHKSIVALHGFERSLAYCPVQSDQALWVRRQLKKLSGYQGSQEFVEIKPFLPSERDAKHICTPVTTPQTLTNAQHKAEHAPEDVGAELSVLQASSPKIQQVPNPEKPATRLPDPERVVKSEHADQPNVTHGLLDQASSSQLKPAPSISHAKPSDLKPQMLASSINREDGKSVPTAMADSERKRSSHRQHQAIDSKDGKLHPTDTPQHKPLQISKVSSTTKQNPGAILTPIDDMASVRPEPESDMQPSHSGYWVELGYFKRSSIAEEVSLRVKKLGYSIREEKRTIKDEEMVRLHAGPFEERKLALKARIELLSNHLDVGRVIAAWD